MSPDNHNPFQSLMADLSEPQNRPLPPPLDPEFKRDLRRRLLAPQTSTLSGKAVQRLWQFGLTAVLLLLLSIGIFNFWLSLANQPATTSPISAPSPTATPTPSPVPTATATPVPTTAALGQPLIWKTAVSYPAIVGDGMQVREVVIHSNPLQRGQPVHFSLLWSANNQPRADYISFIHLRDRNGMMLASHDSALGPTSEWAPNSYTTVDYSVPIPHGAVSDLPLQVVVGLYNAATGERVMGESEDGTVLLAEIDTALVEARIDGTMGSGVAQRPNPSSQPVTVLASVQVVNRQLVQVETAGGAQGWVSWFDP